MHPVHFSYLNRNRITNPDTLFTITKNAWALGHYSLFIPPGLVRVETSRNDGLADTAIAQQIMISAFKDAAGKKLVVNMINYKTEDKDASLLLENLPGNKALRLTKKYVTSAKEGDDIKPYPLNDNNAKKTILNKSNKVFLPARSITTLIFSN